MLLFAADPGAALLAFMTAAGEQRQERDLSFLAGASAGFPVVAATQAHLQSVIDALVARAAAAGAVRSDISGADVYLLMCAPSYVAGYAPGGAAGPVAAVSGDHLRRAPAAGCASAAVTLR